jgi:hypothetical protein
MAAGASKAEEEIASQKTQQEDESSAVEKSKGHGSVRDHPSWVLATPLFRKPEEAAIQLEQAPEQVPQLEQAPGEVIQLVRAPEVVVGRVWRWEEEGIGREWAVEPLRTPLGRKQEGSAQR